MSSEYMFGGGRGHLSRKADEIAGRHGASLCNYTDTSCTCGKGCRPHSCPKSRRHWFATVNMGDPFNTQTAVAVIEELRAEGLIKD